MLVAVTREDVLRRVSILEPMSMLFLYFATQVSSLVWDVVNSAIWLTLL